MSNSDEAARPVAGTLNRRFPWYVACILIPVALGWTPDQVAILFPIIIVLIVLVPLRALI